MKTLAFFSFFLTAAALCAQTIQCPKEDCGRFQAFIKAAQDAAGKPDFNQAIIQYNAARVCCPSAADAIDAEILKVFELIEKQRDEAVFAEKRAKIAETKTRKALDKADALINFFGFTKTQNRAWAYKNGKFAVIDRNATQWTDFIFENPDTFQNNGYALARKGGFYLLVDTLGNTCQEYDFLFPANKKGWYKVKKDKKYTFADYRGIPLPGLEWYDAVDTFKNGMAAVRKDQKWGYIDANCMQVIKPQYYSASSFNGDVAWAWKEREKCGLIDKTGQFVIPAEYSYGEFFSKGLVYAQKPSKWGIIDKKGKFIIPPEYEEIWLPSYRTGRYRPENYYTQYTSYEESAQISNNFYWVRKNDKWGFFNEGGKLIAEPKFNFGSVFSEGLAAVTMDSLSGYIDTAGVFVIPPVFKKTNSFSEGLASAAPKGEGLKYGFINRTGDFVIDPQFDAAGSFSEGVAWVSLENKKERLIDRSGKFLSELEFDEVFYAHFQKFPKNIAAVKQDNKWGFVNRKGEMEITPQFDRVEFGLFNGFMIVFKDSKYGYVAENGSIIEPQFVIANQFSEGLAAVSKDNKWGYIDQTGTFVIPPQYTNAFRFAHGVAWVFKGRVWGLIDKKGKPVSEPQFESVNEFSEGLAAVAIVGEDFRYRWGYTDTTGKLVIPTKFTSASPFREGLAQVTTDDSTGFIDISGNFIYKHKISRNENPDYYHEANDGDRFYQDGLVAVRKEGIWGYIDKTGSWVIPPQFDGVSGFSGGYAKVSAGAENKLLDKAGNTVWEGRFNYIAPASEDMANIREGNKWGFVNLRTGKTIPPQFNKAPNNLSDSVVWVVSNRYDSIYQYEMPKWGLIDKSGNYLIQPRFTEIREFEGDVSWVSDNYVWGLVNKKGEILLKPEMGVVGNFSEGLAWVERDGLRGYVDKTGKVIIPLRYTVGMGYYDERGMYVSPYDNYLGRYSGYTDRYVKRISQYYDYSYEPAYRYNSNTSTEFLSASQNNGNFSGGLAAAYENQKWGYINKSGKFAIEPQYEWVQDFSEGLAWVKKGGKWGVIDPNNQWIVQPQYEWGMKFSEGLAQFVSAGRFGVVDKSGRHVVPAEFDAIANFSEGMAAVKKDDKWGYVNRNGEQVIGVQFDTASDFQNGTARVTKFKEEFIINKMGQIIVEEAAASNIPYPGGTEGSAPIPNDK